MITMNTGANTLQVNIASTAQSATAQTARTQNTAANQSVGSAQVERNQSQAQSGVRREETSRSAAEELAKDNAITVRPDNGISLEISKAGLEREQQAAQNEDENQAARVQAEDDATSTQQRVEEQAEARQRIREQLEEQAEARKQAAESREEANEARQAGVQADEAEDDARTQNITNFAGYTNAQLQQMAQRGEISQNDYRTEIENREEKIEERQQSLGDADRDIARNIDRVDRTERQLGAIDTAFDEDSNTNVNAKTRAEVVQNLENPQNNATGQQNIQREQQQRAFAQWQNDFGFLIR